jgi:hypothetical protein
MVSGRSDGLFKEMVSAAAAPPSATDSVVCLAFASLLLAFSQDEAHRGLLASPASAALLLNLLQVRHHNQGDPAWQLLDTASLCL